MAIGVAEILILGLFIDWLFRKFSVPGLVGMIFAGLILGPFVLGYMKPEMVVLSQDFRLIALVVILLRAGFSLSKEKLCQVGFRAFLLSFVPATGECLAIIFFAPLLLGISHLEAALLGTVVAAVSPAVIVPIMIDFIERKKGEKKGIPTLIMAGASLDDINVIVVHGIILSIYMGGSVNISSALWGIPFSVLTGILIGCFFGYIFCFLFEKFNPRATKRVLIIISTSILFVQFNNVTEDVFPFSPLLASMAMGFAILELKESFAHEIALKLSKIWVFAEIILFVMIGAQLDLNVLFKIGGLGVLVLFAGLMVRVLFTFLCTLKSELNFGERLFVAFSYIPKATVQAAIGAAPLLALREAGKDTYVGEVILAFAVMAIVVTAPLGAFLTRLVGERVLSEDSPVSQKTSS